MMPSKKSVVFLIVSILNVFIAVNLSCKKEKSCEGCRETNKPPTAIAGPGQVINIPPDSISLDGCASNEPMGVSEWRWTKISGPASFNINNSSISNSIVKNFVKGV